jgi:hypothetical protein
MHAKFAAQRAAHKPVQRDYAGGSRSRLPILDDMSTRARSFFWERVRGVFAP